MIPIEQQKQLLKLSGTTEAAYDLVKYSVSRRTFVIMVYPELNPSPGMATLRFDRDGRVKEWGTFVASIVSTGPN